MRQDFDIDVEGSHRRFTVVDTVPTDFWASCKLRTSFISNCHILERHTQIFMCAKDWGYSLVIGCAQELVPKETAE